MKCNQIHLNNELIPELKTTSLKLGFKIINRTPNHEDSIEILIDNGINLVLG